jgi:hypothetical protein
VKGYFCDLDDHPSVLCQPPGMPPKKLDMQLPLGLHADDDVDMLASDGDGGLIFSTHGDAHIYLLPVPNHWACPDLGRA